VGHTVADQLRALGVRGVLFQMAERRQIIELRCEMPQCYCHKGRRYFERRTTPLRDWAPSPDHYPILQSAGGHLVPENVRLSHVLCNRRDYGWRMKIKGMLAKGMALEEIAEKLNEKRVPRHMARPNGRPLRCGAPSSPSAPRSGAAPGMGSMTRGQGMVVLDMSMSLDGFIAGPNVDVERPIRDGGERLHDWIFGGKTDRDAEVLENGAFKNAGSVVMGRRTFDVGEGLWGNDTLQVPCFVLSHDAREELAKGPATFTVTDGERRKHPRSSRSGRR